LIKIIIKEENFKWHLEAFASELFTYKQIALLPEMKKNPTPVSKRVPVPPKFW